MMTTTWLVCRQQQGAVTIKRTYCIISTTCTFCLQPRDEIIGWKPISGRGVVDTEYRKWIKGDTARIWMDEILAICAGLRVLQLLCFFGLFFEVCFWICKVRSCVPATGRAMAAMATAAGMARLHSAASASASCSAALGPRPVASFASRRHHALLPTTSGGGRHLGSLHLARARNVPAERKSVTVTPAEPEMSPAELKAYEETCAKLEGQQPDFFEGSGWNALGWTIQYLWVFGIVVSIMACITAVRTYNLGATDFKKTEVFKEAIEFQTDGAEESALDESNREAP